MPAAHSRAQYFRTSDTNRFASSSRQGSQSDARINMVHGSSLRSAHHRIEELETENARLTEVLTQSEQQAKVIIKFLCTHHVALAQELHSVVRQEVRLDTDDVLRGHKRITVKELDAQLEWHRMWRAKYIPRSGNKETKMRRWANAVEQYKVEVGANLDWLLRETDVADISESDSAMSVDGLMTDHMDVDAVGNVHG